MGTIAVCQSWQWMTVGLPTQLLDALQHGAAEEDKAVGVVLVHIDAVAVVVVRVVDHIDRDIAAGAGQIGVQEPGLLGAVVQRHQVGREHLVELKALAVDPAIARHGHIEHRGRGP